MSVCCHCVAFACEYILSPLTPVLPVCTGIYMIVQSCSLSLPIHAQYCSNYTNQIQYLNRCQALELQQVDQTKLT